MLVIVAVGYLAARPLVLLVPLLVFLVGYAVTRDVEAAPRWAPALEAAVWALGAVAAGWGLRTLRPGRGQRARDDRARGPGP